MAMYMILPMLLCFVFPYNAINIVEGDNNHLLTLTKPSRPDNNVAFCAIDANNGFGLDSDSVIIFANVYENEGGSYAPESGYFTTLQAGTYRFYWSVEGYSTWSTHETALYVNSTSKVSSNEITEGWSQAGNSAILDLNVGDQVSVVLRAGSYMWGRGDSASFSGHLLAAGSPKFFVTSTNTLEASNGDRDVLFNKINLNPDNNFNPITGAFMAPIHGVYQFTWACTSLSTNYSSHTYLEVNGTPVAAAFDGPPSVATMAQNTAVVEMQPGETAKVVLKHRGIIQDGGVAMGSSTTAFSGHMLFDLTSTGMQDKIAFMVVRTFDHAFEDVIYNNVVTNTGGGYSTTYDRFEAPVRGVYQFQCSGLLSRPGILRLRRNGFQNLASAEDASQSTVTQSVIIELGRGESVNVYSSALTSGSGSDTFSTFSGSLLFRV